MEYSKIDRTATHEFGMKRGAALFWLIQFVNPLQPEEDC
jgi:hypothetical protein